MTQPLCPLPAQPAGTDWPTDDWPVGSLPDGIKKTAFSELVNAAFDGDGNGDLGATHALLIVKDGRIVHERYAAPFDATQTFPSWSMAKSITHALTGLLAGDGRIDIRAPADVPEWQTDGDPRRAITLDHLLRMSSGLDFQEDYNPDHPSDVIEMLFGSGKDDVAHFAASFPLAHAPGSYWSYSSGTTNIVARALSRALGGGPEDFEAFMRARLFDPIGMRSPLPKFDKAGTFIGSSFCFATARDFARFGLLYLRDGVWNGKRLLPKGWVDYARTATPQPTDTDSPLGYGAHWWLGMGGPHSFSANGYNGQYTVIAPDIDLILVRHGESEAVKDNVRQWIGAVIDCFRES